MTFYPGSRMKVKIYPDEPVINVTVAGDTIPGTPRRYTVAGNETEFWTTGVLAEVLNRKSVTIRKWENEGIIPKSLFTSPSPDPRGKRRLYTREMILGIRDIASEEGILEPNSRGKWKAVEGTEFRNRVARLFKEISENYKK
jgi:hypothetical protein